MSKSVSSATNFRDETSCRSRLIDRYSWRNLIYFSLLSATIFSMIGIICIRYNVAAEVGKAPSTFTDFDAFYTAGKMFWAGELNKAYVPKYFFSALEADSQKRIFMPWTYPPPYNLLAIALSSIDRATSYALFTSISLIAFFIAVYRLSGDLITMPVLLTAPAAIITIMGGQNSFLTAALVAIFCHAMMSRGTIRQVGDVSLGLMVIKPHLALGLGLMLILQRKWVSVAWVLMTVLALLLISLFAFGHEIFSSFMSAISYSKFFLQQGLYPMDRMTSVYAFVFGISGKNYLLSIAIHTIVTISALACIWYSISHRWEIHRVLSVACVATLMVSPYNYDYDAMILAIPLSLAARELVVFSSAYEKVLLVSLCWLTTGWGTLSTFWVKDLSALEGSVYSFGGLGLVGFFIVFLRILMKAESANERGREDQQELC